MYASVLTAAASFVSTNIDDIFLLMLFFAQTASRREKLRVTAGQLLGIGILTAASVLGAAVLRHIPGWILGLLGLIPMALGVRAWLSCRRSSEEEESVSAGTGVWSVMLVTIANGADNVGVYVPLFAGFSAGQTAAAAAVFLLMTLLWCVLGERLSSLPLLGNAIRRYRRILVPVLLIGLGLWILWENILFPAV